MCLIAAHPQVEELLAVPFLTPCSAAQRRVAEPGVRQFLSRQCLSYLCCFLCITRATSQLASIQIQLWPHIKRSSGYFPQEWWEKAKDWHQTEFCPPKWRGTVPEWSKTRCSRPTAVQSSDGLNYTIRRLGSHRNSKPRNRYLPFFEHFLNALRDKGVLRETEPVKFSNDTLLDEKDQNLKQKLNKSSRTMTIWILKICC